MGQWTFQLGQGVFFSKKSPVISSLVGADVHSSDVFDYPWMSHSKGQILQTSRLLSYTPGRGTLPGGDEPLCRWLAVGGTGNICSLGGPFLDDDEERVSLEKRVLTVGCTVSVILKRRGAWGSFVRCQIRSYISWSRVGSSRSNRLRVRVRVRV